MSVQIFLNNFAANNHAPALLQMGREPYRIQMKRTLTLLALALTICIGAVAQNPTETPVSYAFLRGDSLLTLKYKYSYEGGKYFTNFRLIRGSKGVLRQGDKIYVMKADGGQLEFEYDAEKAELGTDYVPFETSLADIEQLQKGNKGIFLYRDETLYGFAQPEQWNNMGKKYANQIVRRAQKVDKKKKKAAEKQTEPTESEE